jgi:lactonase
MNEDVGPIDAQVQVCAAVTLDLHAVEETKSADCKLIWVARAGALRRFAGRCFPSSARARFGPRRVGRPLFSMQENSGVATVNPHGGRVNSIHARAASVARRQWSRMRDARARGRGAMEGDGSMSDGLRGAPVVASDTLSYADGTRGLVPLPASERDLPTAIAQPYFKVSDGLIGLEGPAFDRQGNLLFVDVFGGRILKLSPERQLSTVYTEPDLHPAGIAIHQDGRIFIAALGAMDPDAQFRRGTVIAIDPDGRNRQTIVSPHLGHVLDDIVFDNEGGLYMTDFRGSSTLATGGVFYVSPDFKSIRPVLPDMCGANGVALSPDSKVLWATEFCNNRLHRADLTAPGVVGRFGALIPYHFVGRAPDSMRTDSAGNVYVAMYHQARFLVFSPYGIPIGQILLPGRENGHFLKSTSLALVPGSRDLYMVARDELGGRGSWIFAAKGLAEGFRMFSHQ